MHPSLNCIYENIYFRNSPSIINYYHTRYHPDSYAVAIEPFPPVMKFLKLLPLCCACFAFLPAHSQHDYLQMPIQDSVLECGNRDSFKTLRLIQLMQSINTDSITSNKQVYYKDLGMCYYNLFIMKSDTSFLRLAIREYDRSIKQDSTYYYSYWNAAVSYYILNDCKHCNAYLQKYMALAPKKNWDKTTMNTMKKRCRKNKT